MRSPADPARDHPLARELLRRRPGDAGRGLKLRALLEARLREQLAAARAAWPGVDVADEVFVAQLAARLPAEDGLPQALERLRVGELFLACACAAGDAEAISTFERVYLGAPLSKVLSSKGVGPGERDELVQHIRIKLFFPQDGRPPRIAEYSGTGPLAGWLRVLAVRMVLDLRWSVEKGEPADLSLSDFPHDAPDPLSAYLERRHRREFKDAFQAAVNALPRKQRTLLKLHHLDGVSLDALGAVYHVDRATVARWLARSREDIIAGTRRFLIERNGIGTAEVDSLLRAAQSGLDLSLRRILGKSSP